MTNKILLISEVGTQKAFKIYLNTIKYNQNTIFYF